MASGILQDNMNISNISHPLIHCIGNGADILPPTTHITLNVLCVVITALGLISNSLVVYLFISGKVKSNAFNLLLLNLSIADIIAGISAYPYVFVNLIQLRDYSSKTANLICAFTHGMTPFIVASAVSILTLCFISINRYMLIRYPLRSYWIKNKRNIIVFIIVVWPLCIALLSPNVISFQYYPRSAICYRRWPKEFNGKLFSAVISFIGYMLPIIVMMITFCAAGCKLWDKNLGASDSVISEASLKRKRKAFILLGYLILAFFACWGPFFGYLVLSRSTKAIFPDGERGECMRMRVVRFVFLIAVCNTFADPLVYGFRGEEFRKGFYQTVRGVSMKISGLGTTSNSVPGSAPSK